MNQRSQGSGSNRQRQNNQVEQRHDQAVDEPQVTAGQMFNAVIRGVEGMRDAIEAVLPRGQSFGAFRAIVMMAIRHNPDILTCSTTSIITSCMKAAYDGVMLDGVEAALVPSMNKVKDPVTNREFTRRDARYNIMIRGMRKQLIAGGIVRDFQSTIVYSNDKFSYKRGLNPSLEHEPVLDHDKRGEMVGAYSVAWFHDGGMPSFEVMNKKQIEDVREMSQSGPVWKGKMLDEMWRKTVARRHRKALPGGNDIPDMEARDDFPQFVKGDLTPHQAHDGELPAKTQSGNAPRRADFAQLESGGGEAGIPLDLGNSGEMTAEEVEREERREQQQGVPRDQQRQAAPVQQEAEVEKEKVSEPRTIGPAPEGFSDWNAWADDVASRMKVAATLSKLDAVTNDTKALYDTAPDDVQQRLAELYEEKATDHREAVK